MTWDASSLTTIMDMAEANGLLPSNNDRTNLVLELENTDLNMI